LDVRYETDSGWPSALENLWRRVSAYTRGDRIIGWKVGLTNNPERRAYSYDRDTDYYYDEMVAIYETSSIKNARDLEFAITSEYDGYCDNERLGGAGPDSATPPYYVYLVLKRK